ncbi:hypothetical protein NFI96_005777 [Prochilodus magdalenae]|nr:hypothetical protein NFI96_005777 [Prochilodus magdalenae]
MDYHLMFILLMLSIESWSSSWGQLSLQTGGTVTIPCHYDMKYIHHKKYWCFDAKAQSLFTVTMRDLRSGDTGMYYCVVEIGGLMEPDVKEQMEITVKSDPDLSVVESSVSGQEEGSVSVRCLYSAGYKNKQKQWCRSKDWSCYTVGRTSTSQNSAVQISDDGGRSFSVEMSGLQRSDAGWYWCKAGDLQIPVHLNVSDASAEPVTSVTCAQVKPALICEKHKAPVADLPILVFCGKCQSSSTVLATQSLFTVTMRDLRSGDTGTYWCVVEIGGIMEPDVKEQMEITVKSDPDLSVVNSSVSGQEEGNVSVQCLYSAGYKNKQKQWCRSKDWRCYTVGRTSTSQNSAVEISDDGGRSFSVEMSGLQRSDAGWYWCKTGDPQVPVHLSVSDAPAVANKTTRNHISYLRVRVDCLHTLSVSGDYSAPFLRQHSGTLHYNY